jgi:Ni/Fe-hydrogenase subunit HybB-like protein
MVDREGQEKRFRGLPGLLWVLLATGAATFLLAVNGPNKLRVWQILLVNFLFWSGMAQGGLVFAAIYQVTQARWGGAVKRLAEGMAAFLPLSFLLFLLLFFGREVLFPWVLKPVPEKGAWLTVPFLFLRDGLSLLILYGVSFAYLYYALRPDLGMTYKDSSLFTRGWRGLEAERERSRRVLAILAPIFLLLYALVFSLIGFDLAMSLDPHWHSTLFGAYFFLSSFYVGLATLAIIAVLARRHLKLGGEIGRTQFHDLGKLIFGFCLVTGDFFWSQFVVIWYGNLPEETGYVILRAMEMPWAPLSWAVLIVGFIGPFLVLLSRRVKESPWTLFTVASFIVAGMWLERYILVAPSLWHTPSLPLGWIELSITLGFFAAFALSYLAFVTRLPFPRTSSETTGHLA